MAQQTQTGSKAPLDDRSRRDTPDLPGGYSFRDISKTATVFQGSEYCDPSPEPVAPLWVWVNPEHGRSVAIYQSDEHMDDGYPYVTAKYVHTTYGGFWKHTAIYGSWDHALRGLENVTDRLTYKHETEPGTSYTEWLDATGGTEYDSPMADILAEQE